MRQLPALYTAPSAPLVVPAAALAASVPRQVPATVAPAALSRGTVSAARARAALRGKRQTGRYARPLPPGITAADYERWRVNKNGILAGDQSYTDANGERQYIGLFQTRAGFLREYERYSGFTEAQLRAMRKYEREEQLADAATEEELRAQEERAASLRKAQRVKRRIDRRAADAAIASQAAAAGLSLEDAAALRDVYDPDEEPADVKTGWPTLPRTRT